MIEIVRYISRELKNPSAADQLATELIEAGDSLLPFPYVYLVYLPIRQLGHEYRKLTVGNYFMFYWVDEEKKTVPVSRVLWKKGH